MSVRSSPEGELFLQDLTWTSCALHTCGRPQAVQIPGPAVHRVLECRQRRSPLRTRSCHRDVDGLYCP